MAIPERFIDELKARVSVSQVLGQKVRLIPHGREFKALCPFHKEKTPSFTVNDEKGFYYCFGCQAKGNQISFLMEHDRLSFVEAIEQLASLAGLTVPQDSAETRAQDARQTALSDLVSSAQRFYRQALTRPEAAAARTYLQRRGVQADSQERFALGYAPPAPRGSRSPLTGHLLAQGFTPEQILAAGLARQPEDGRAPYDFFRDRLMFPIADARGRAIGFGGRVLGDGEPKYLNSPDGPLFDKGRTLYGLPQAREAARSKNRLLITEGYMDVIALSEAGFAEAVAPLGTAITEQHFLAGWRTAADLLLCLDGDSAGQRAALRAAERCLPVLQTGKRLHFVALPTGEDPDSFIRRFGVQAFADLLSQARPLVELLWSTTATAAGAAGNNPDAAAADRKRLRALTSSIPDPDLAASYQRLFDERLRAAQRPANRPPRTPAAGATGRAATSARAGRATGGTGLGAPMRSNHHPAHWMQRHQFELLLVAFLHHPSLLERYDEALGSLELPFADLARLRDALLDCLCTASPTGEPTALADSSALLDQLDQQGEAGESARELHQRSRGFSEEGARKTHGEAQAARLLEHLFTVMQT